ncbi:MAG: metallophosphoesterase [Verrucomicrobiae bacterium]|nr:metallophosphoesterase [Verrucomicrobiae bacterium]
MIEADEKSTSVAAADLAEVAPGVWLDSRRALVHREAGWLAAADVHFGYEVTRRAEGGLFPLWGMSQIETQFAALIEDHSPETIILAGDIVDSGWAGSEANAWLESLRDRCAHLVLVAGNHDRGAIRKAWDFVPNYQTSDGAFFFHHGHESPEPEVPGNARVSISGHLHPRFSLNDGAGLSLRIPTLVQEQRPAENFERWVLPAFSPWSGGAGWKAQVSGSEARQWACGQGRVFEV